jgi:hypothetical protein
MVSSGHSGTALLHETADRLGLTRALSRGLAAAFPHCRQHDPGSVVRDLAVMLADGGDCLSDLCVLRDHPDLFGRGFVGYATSLAACDKDPNLVAVLRDVPEVHAYLARKGMTFEDVVTVKREQRLAL